MNIPPPPPDNAWTRAAQELFAGVAQALREGDRETAFAMNLKAAECLHAAIAVAIVSDQLKHIEKEQR